MPPGREILWLYGRRAFEAGVRGWRWLFHRNAFTTPAVLLALLILFWLPQTQHLLWQLPTAGGLSGMELVLSGLFALFIVAVAVGFIALAWLVVPRPGSGGWSPGRPEGEGRWTRVPLGLDPPPPARGRFDVAVEPLVRLAERLAPRHRRRFGWSGFALGAILFAMTRAWGAFLPSWWRTGGLTWTVILALTGLWLGLASAVPSGIRLGYKRNLIGRFLWVLILTSMIAQILWTATNALPSLMSSRVYTFYAILSIVFLLVASARLIDACHVYSLWNIRIWTLFGLGMGLALMPSQHVGSFWRLPPRPTERNPARTAEPPATPPAGGTSSTPAAVPSTPVQPGATGAAPDRSSVFPGPRLTGRHSPLIRRVSWGPQAGPVPQGAPTTPDNGPAPPAPASAPSVQSAPPAVTEPAVTVRSSPTLPMNETIQKVWFRSLWWKLSVLPPDQPVVFVAASGGGARAALFTSLVLESLRNTPLPATSSATHPDFIPVNGQYPSLADQIVLVSSVSGGSLATAYYVHQSYPHVRAVRGRHLDPDTPAAQSVSPQPLGRTTWRNAFPSDIYNRMQARSLAMLDSARIGRGQVVTGWAGAGFEETLERVAYECGWLASRATNGASGTPASPSIAPWLARSAFVDDMATDFMAPLLRGILTPGLERGESVSRFWEDQFGWRDVSDMDLHRRLDPNRTGLVLYTNQAPLVMFNTCDVVQGSRLVLGFPPVPPGVIRDPVRGASSHGPYALTDRGDLYYHLGLAEAVRLSANFPFGFEVAQLPLKAGAEPVLALDGGIVDNSGIDSITYLIEGLDRLAWSYERMRNRTDPTNPNPSPEELGIRHCDSLEAQAYRVLHELARRGVVLIQIDSGTKEIQTGNSAVSRVLAGLGGAVVRPLQALNNTSYTNAENAVQNFDLALQRLLRRRKPLRYLCSSNAIQPIVEEPQMASAPQASAKVVPSRDCFVPFEPNPEVKAPLIWRVRLTCNQSANVMTAWTLGPEDKAQVLVQFLIEWQHQRPVLLHCWEYVRRAAVFAAPPPHNVAIPASSTWGPPNAEFYYYQVGQRLADRARSEFYQMVSTPTDGAPASVAAPPFDEATRADLKAYDRYFRSSAVIPMRIDPSPAPVPVSPTTSRSVVGPPVEEDNDILPAAPASPSPPGSGGPDYGPVENRPMAAPASPEFQPEAPARQG